MIGERFGESAVSPVTLYTDYAMPRPCNAPTMRCPDHAIQQRHYTNYAMEQTMDQPSSIPWFLLISGDSV